MAVTSVQTDLNLNRGELINARIENVATLAAAGGAASAARGRMIFNVSDLKMYFDLGGSYAALLDETNGVKLFPAGAFATGHQNGVANLGGISTNGSSGMQTNYLSVLRGTATYGNPAGPMVDVTNVAVIDSTFPNVNSSGRNTGDTTANGYFANVAQTGQGVLASVKDGSAFVAESEDGTSFEARKSENSNTLNYVLNGKAKDSTGTYYQAAAVDWKGVLMGYNSPNYVQNGQFEIWQRGEAATQLPASTVRYFADRWSAYANGTGHNIQISKRTITTWASTDPDNSRTALRWNMVTAGTGTTIAFLAHQIDDVEKLAGRKCTISFWAVASSALNITVAVKQFFGTSGSAKVDVVSTARSLTTAWKRYSVTFDMPSVATKVAGSTRNFTMLQFFFPNTAGITVDLTNCQLEISDFMTPYRVQPWGDTLLDVSRCYQKSFSYATAPIVNAGGVGSVQVQAIRAGANLHHFWVPFRVPMRATPTIIIYGQGATGSEVTDATIPATCSSTSVLAGTSENSLRVSTVTNSSTSIGNILAFHWTADAEDTTFYN